MSERTDRSDAIGRVFAGIVLKSRWLLVLLAILAAGLVATGIPKLTSSNNYRVYFSPENPELQAFEKFQGVYAKSDNIAFIVTAKDGSDIFTPANVEGVFALTERAWQMPFTRRVDSITNYQHTYADGDELIVENLVDEPSLFDADGLRAREAIALGEPLLSGALISTDGKAAIVNVTLVFPEIDVINEVPETVEAGRSMRDEFVRDFPQLNVNMTGTAMLNIAFVEAIAADFKTLIPAMIVIILVGTAISARSVSAMFSVLLLVIFASLIAMGWAGHVGIRLAGPSPSAVIVVLTLSVASAIHILMTTRGRLQGGMVKRDAIFESVRVNFLPVSVTSITTMIGFLALNFSDSPPFRDFGNIAAVGIFAAWILSLTLLPALMMITPFGRNVQLRETGVAPFATVFGAFIVAHWRKFLVLTGVSAIWLASLIPTVTLSDEWRKYFDERIEFRRDSDAMVQYFGYHPVEYSIDSGTPGGVTDPAYLDKLALFADWLRSDPRVAHVSSLSDIIKKLNQNLNGDDPGFYLIPEQQDLAAQYLLLYELSLPYGLDLNDKISIDKSASRLTATLVGDATTKDTREFLHDSRAWFAANAPELQATPTGSQVMFTYIAQRNVNSMIVGTFAAIGLIAAVMVFALASVRLGLLSIAPNALPIISGFGLWALLVGEVGFSVAAIASLSLGIVIDDTVHFMTKYVRGMRVHGLSPEEAVVSAVQQVGGAIAASTLILMAGFGILAFSAFKINAELGMLTTMTIGLALVFDALFLPGLLIAVSGKRNRRASDRPGEKRV